MPPKNKYSEEDIIKAAFNVVRKSGWQNCTARSIAEELGSSTMPIYSYLSSMADLKTKILQKATDLMIDYQTRIKTDIDFLDMGVGYVLFAKEEKNLFRLMYRENINEKIDTEFEKNKDVSFIGYAFETLLDRLAGSTVLAGFSREEKKKILYHAWIFSHGLAVLINNGIRSDLDETGITEILKDFGRCLINGSRPV